MIRLTDQECPCGARVTASQRGKGFRPFYDFIVIGYLDTVQRVTFCVDCEVKLNRLLEGKA